MRCAFFFAVLSFIVSPAVWGSIFYVAYDRIAEKDSARNVIGQIVVHGPRLHTSRSLGDYPCVGAEDTQPRRGEQEIERHTDVRVGVITSSCAGGVASA